PIAAIQCCQGHVLQNFWHPVYHWDKDCPGPKSNPKWAADAKAFLAEFLDSDEEAEYEAIVAACSTVSKSENEEPESNEESDSSTSDSEEDF
ncbi:hypothetical protein FRC11_009262, partial [Ceratobasidium sp. 423]